MRQMQAKALGSGTFSIPQSHQFSSLALYPSPLTHHHPLLIPPNSPTPHQCNSVKNNWLPLPPHNPLPFSVYE